MRILAHYLARLLPRCTATEKSPNALRKAALCKRLSAYSCSDAAGLGRLIAIAEEVIQRKIPGDFVECGVFNCGSAAAIASTLVNTDKLAWLYDSFAGLPPITARDPSSAAAYVGKCVDDISMVKQALQHAGFPVHRTVFRKNLFRDTFHHSKSLSCTLMLTGTRV
jgi:O-methyltransferase